ncbi:MAG TPA: hypothetical protein VGJ78_22570 [Vicinamibacterales bacterium]|jgi:hypothetical protein
MRFLIASLVVVTVICLGPAAWPVLAWAQGQPAQGQPPQGKLDVDINVGHSGGGGAWWNNPIWIAIGVIALVLLVIIITMAARGSGTTVIKE